VNGNAEATLQDELGQLLKSVADLGEKAAEVTSILGVTVPCETRAEAKPVTLLDGRIETVRGIRASVELAVRDLVSIKREVERI